MGTQTGQPLSSYFTKVEAVETLMPRIIPKLKELMCALK